MIVGRFPDVASQEQRIALKHCEPAKRWQA